VDSSSPLFFQGLSRYGKVRRHFCVVRVLPSLILQESPRALTVSLPMWELHHNIVYRIKQTNQGQRSGEGWLMDVTGIAPEGRSRQGTYTELGSLTPNESSSWSRSISIHQQQRQIYLQLTSRHETIKRNYHAPEYRHPFFP
jgi:hypothetical protein